MQQHRQVQGGGGRAGQPTVPANQGDQRGAGHSMMQGGGGGSNLSCQLLQAASTETPTQVTRPRQQACSQAVGGVGNEKIGLLIISRQSMAMSRSNHLRKPAFILFFAFNIQ